MSKEEAKRHFQVAKMYLQEGALEKAIEEYKRALVFAPQYPDIYFHLGVAYEYKMAYQEALLQFQKALQLHPAYTDAKLHVGIVHFKQKELDRAKRELEEILQVEPNSAFVHFYLGEIALERAKSNLGSYEEAIASYEKAIALDRTFTDAYMSLGKALRKVGRTEESNRAFDRADKLKKGLPLET